MRVQQQRIEIEHELSHKEFYSKTTYFFKELKVHESSPCLYVERPFLLQSLQTG
uniref:Uncharacterized protein n=1 Tax=Rhizophora mucronata TaxID=61149 RepID=A0A2P2KAM3_RHIMU